MGLANLVSPRHRTTHGSGERSCVPMILFVAIIGILLAVMAFFTFDKVDGSLHRNKAVALGSATEADGATPAILMVRAGSTRAKVDQIAVTDAKII